MIKIDLRMDPKFCSNFKGITWGNGTKYSFFQENSLVEKKVPHFAMSKFKMKFSVKILMHSSGLGLTQDLDGERVFFTEDGGGKNNAKW